MFRSRETFLMFQFAFYLFLDIYTFFGLRSLFSKQRTKNIFSAIYVALSVYVFYCFWAVLQVMRSGNVFSDTSANWELGIMFTAVVSKLVFSIFMSVHDGGRFFYGIVDFIKNKITNNTPEEGRNFFPTRRKFLTLLATGIASVPFFGMLYGITKGKYQYTVSSLKLQFKDLPEAFDGFKIVQISDIHSGSFDDPDELVKGVELINEQKPDLFLFTGDLVNADKDEVNPYIEIFEKIRAKQGKYAILGNHDYYGEPELDEGATEKDISDYWEDFYKKFEQMGFNLLNNASEYIEKDGQRIALAGVENWGASRHFPKRGDLDKAFENVQDDDFCILMSHDPSHWDKKIIEHKKHVNLTLSGHTHGMQFGIKMPGFKWSPVQYRYPRWAGLYNEAQQYLYVNTGFGFLAFPGRVGMWPEVTVIELERI